MAVSDIVYVTGYMKRISFLDGQVLHDYHLNIMQRNIAESLKVRTTRERYDFYLLVSPYEMYYHDPLISEENKDPSSTALFNNLTFSFSSGSWESKMITAPRPTEEICLVSNFEDFPTQDANVHFYYRTAVGNDWIPMTPDQPVYLQTPNRYFQVKAECIYTGTIRPVVYDYALLMK